MAKSEAASLVSEFNIKDYADLDYIREDQIEDVIRLYQEVYNVDPRHILTQRNYPYPEVFDPEWVRRTAFHPDTIWKLVTDVRTGQVIGSGTVQLDRANQRAYVRGIMIHPQYQGFKLGGYILVNAFKELIRDYRDMIKIFWTENRTAHVKSQKMAEASGMYPVALLPLKDYFLSQRETDILYVLYSMNIFRQRRAELRLIPEILPTFEVIRKQFRLDSVEPEPSIDISNSNGYQVTYHSVCDKYYYKYYTFKINGTYLKFMVNPRTQAAEKMHFPQEIAPSILKRLLRYALRVVSPFYIECYISAYEPAIQQVFIDLGFQATGYIPAWETIDGHREDRILMSRVQAYPRLTDLKLTPRGVKLAKLFLT